MSRCLPFWTISPVLTTKHSKFFTAESREQTRYVTALKDYQRSDFKVTASLNFLNLIQNAVTSLGLIIGSLVVAFSVVQGTRTVGQFVMFLTYLTQLSVITD